MYIAPETRPASVLSRDSARPPTTSMVFFVLVNGVRPPLPVVTFHLRHVFGGSGGLTRATGTMTRGIHGLRPMATRCRRVRGLPIAHAAAEPRQQVAVGVSPRSASCPSNHGSRFMWQAAKTATARSALRLRFAIASTPAAAFAATNWHDVARDPWAHAHGYALPPRSRLAYRACCGGAATAGSRGREPTECIVPLQSRFPFHVASREDGDSAISLAITFCNRVHPCRRVRGYQLAR